MHLDRIFVRASKYPTTASRYLHRNGNRSGSWFVQGHKIRLGLARIVRPSRSDRPTWSVKWREHRLGLRAHSHRISLLSLDPPMNVDGWRRAEIEDAL